MSHDKAGDQTLLNPDVKTTQQETDNKYEVGSLGRKLPPFWKSDPVLWFTQIEAVFNTARINQPLTMFQYVISVLDIDVLAQVADIVKNPGRNPYEDIKNRLIQVYSDSEHKRITKLLESSQLGNQKPSAFLRQMIQLANGSVSDDILRTLWLRNLPARVQTILAATAHTDPHKLAEVADKILEVDRSLEVFSTQQDTRQDLLCQLASQIACLKLQVDNLSRDLRTHQQRGRSPFRRPFSKSPYRYSRNNSKSPARTPAEGANRQRKCFYHYRFGAKARNCVQPCSWVPSEQPLNTSQ